MSESKTLLVATVGTPSCQRAEDEAIDRARETGANVVFTYVADDSFLGDDTLLSHTGFGAEASLERIGRRLLDRAADKAEEAGVDHETLLLEGGPVLERIAEAADLRDAATIYLGKQKWGFLKRRFQDVDDQELRERTGRDVRVVAADEDD